MPIDFSSLWRYESGKNVLNAFEATQQSIGTSQMIQLLRSVNEGTTEHSVYHHSWPQAARKADMISSTHVDDLYHR